MVKGVCRAMCFSPHIYPLRVKFHYLIKRICLYQKGVPKSDPRKAYDISADKNLSDFFFFFLLLLNYFTRLKNTNHLIIHSWSFHRQNSNFYNYSKENSIKITGSDCEILLLCNFLSAECLEKAYGAIWRTHISKVLKRRRIYIPRDFPYDCTVNGF